MTKEKKKEYNINEEFLRTNKRARILLIVGAISAILAPVVLTWSTISFIDFNSTGQIGDTIGGITAPIVGLVGAILVYFSFTEQRKANKMQWQALEKERTDRQTELGRQEAEIRKNDKDRIFNHLQGLVDELQNRWDRYSQKKQNLGPRLMCEGISSANTSSSERAQYIEGVEGYQSNIIQLTSILTCFIDTFERIDAKEILSDSDRRFLLLRMNFFFAMNLSWILSVRQLIKTKYLEYSEDFDKLKWISVLQENTQRIRSISDRLSGVH